MLWAVEPRVRLPLTATVPMELPGLSVPLTVMVRLVAPVVMVPLPESVWPVPKVWPDAPLAETSRVPRLLVVPRLMLVLPERVPVEESTRGCP